MAFHPSESSDAAWVATFFTGRKDAEMGACARRRRVPRPSSRAAIEDKPSMPKKPGTNLKGEFAFFNVVYEDDSVRSNRRVPNEILGGLEGDEPARGFIWSRTAKSLRKLAGPLSGSSASSGSARRRSSRAAFASRQARVAGEKAIRIAWGNRRPHGRR
jgi:hypothetical protein